MNITDEQFDALTQPVRMGDDKINALFEVGYEVGSWDEVLKAPPPPIVPLDENARRQWMNNPVDTSDVGHGLPPPNPIDYAYNALASGAAGAAQFVPDLLNAGAAAGLPTRRAAVATQGAIESALPKDPYLQESFWFTKLPSGIGSTAPYVAARLIPGGAAIATGLGAAQNAGQVYDEALRSGASEADARNAAAWALPIGAAEGASSRLGKLGPLLGKLGPLLGKWNRATNGGLAKAVEKIVGKPWTEIPLGMAVEGIQEALQQVGNNTIAKQIYDADRDLLDGALESGAVGGLVGGFFSGIAVAAGRKRPLTPEAVHQWMLTAPREQVEAIAASPEPSRSQVASVPIKLMDKESRAIFRNIVRETLDAEPATPQAATGNAAPMDVGSPDFNAPPPKDFGVPTAPTSPAPDRVNPVSTWEEIPVTVGPPTQEQPNAQAVRSDEGSVSVPGNVASESQVDGGGNIQQPAQASAPPAQAVQRAEQEVAPPLKPLESMKHSELVQTLKAEQPDAVIQPGVTKQRLMDAILMGREVKAAPDVTAKPLDQAKADLSSAFDELTKYLSGRVSSTPLDPEMFRLMANVAKHAVRVGVKTVEEFIQQVTQRFGKSLSARERHLAELAWHHANQVPELGERKENLVQRNLANLGDTPEARKLSDAADVLREARGEPGVRHDVDVVAEAERRMKADYEGERQKIVEAGIKGQQISDVETAIARRIFNSETIEAMASSDPNALLSSVGLADAYRRSKTETARALRQSFDRSATPEQRNGDLIRQALLTPPDGKDPKSWAKDLPALFERLKALGLDLGNKENVKAILAEPALAAKALRTIQAQRSGLSDRLFEYWRNAILSAPTTQVVNIGSNAIHGAWHFGPERFLEAAANLVLRRKDGARFGEFKEILAGVLPGMSKGAQNFMRTWQTEMPSFENALGLPGAQKWDAPTVAIPGKIGRAIRSPQRLLLAADDFFKTMFWQMDVGAQAHRLGVSNGLKGNELSQFVADQVADPYSEAADSALNTAHELTFTSGSPRLGSVLKAREDWHLRYFLPFVTTPFNVFKTGARKSPIGSLSLAHKLYRGIRKGDWSGISKSTGEQIIAWIVTLGLFAMVDDEDPIITGSSAAMPSKPDQSIPPQSIRIGDRWYSYARIEPFATMLAMAVDVAAALKSGDMVRIASAPLQSFAGQVATKTFLQGIGDIYKILSRPTDAPEKLAEFATKFAVSWVPNLVRSSSRATKDTVSERKVWGESSERTARLARRMIQGTELGIIPDQPMVDLWGKPLPSSRSPVPNTDILWRMFVPIQTREVSPRIGDRYILAYNAAHPEDEHHPQVPTDRRLKTASGYRDMTDEEWSQFLQRSGSLASRIVDGSSLDPEHPTERGMKFIEDTLEEARRRTRLSMAREAAAKGNAQ